MDRCPEPFPSSVPHITSITVIDCKVGFSWHENTHRSLTNHSPPVLLLLHQISPTEETWELTGSSGTPQIEDHFGMQAFIHAPTSSYLCCGLYSAPTTTILLWSDINISESAPWHTNPLLLRLLSPDIGFIRFDFAHRFAITVLLLPICKSSCLFSFCSVPMKPVHWLLILLHHQRTICVTTYGSPALNSAEVSRMMIYRFSSRVLLLPILWSSINQ